MRTLLFLALASVAGCAVLVHYDMPKTRVQNSVVKVTEETRGNPDGVCTGIVLAQDRVLTAAQCVGEAMQADGQSAIIL